MTFNLWTFLFQVLNFVVLAYVLHRLLYRPLHEAIDRRRQTMAQAQKAAEAARQGAEALQQRLRVEQDALEASREAVLREAREQALDEVKKLRAATEQTLQARRQEARAALDREREEALASLRTEVIDQALGVARRLLAQATDRSLDRQLLQHLQGTLQAIPEDELGPLREEWRDLDSDGALLEVAEVFDDNLRDELTRTVQALAGSPVRLNVKVRPDLLAGGRLRLGGQVWDGSLAGQLDTPHSAPEVTSA